MLPNSSPGRPLHQSQAQTLSPVSPKPLHFSSPSSISVLENQMDPAFNDTSNFLDFTAESKFTTEKGYHAPGAVPETTLQVSSEVANDVVNGSSDMQQSSGADEDFDQSVYTTNSGEAVHNQSTSSFPFQKSPNQASVIAPQLMSEIEPASQWTGTATDKAREPSLNVPDLDTSAATKADQEGDEVDEPYQPWLQNETVTNSTANDTGPGDALQALLDNLSASIPTTPAVPTPHVATATLTSPGPSDNTRNTLPPTSITPSAISSPTALLPSAPNLPPRPPPVENPGSNALGTDIRSYHLHDKTPTTSKLVPPQPSINLRPPGNVPPPLFAGAPGTTLAANGLPPPPVPTFQQAPPATLQPQASPLPPGYRQRDPLDRPESAGSRENGDENRPWSPERNKQYDAFLEEERRYVTEGQWDKFPQNSRLFIGNLPSEKVTKRDLYHVFHKHGRLAQISIKQAYGFIQYLEASSCYRALQAEQGVAIRGRRIHLEISKPQRNTGNKGQGGGGDGRHRNRRSRSPDYKKGNTGNTPRGTDRYNGGNNRQQFNDNYRPRRSPSPMARGGRESNRMAADRWSGRRRSRSPQSPYGRNSRQRTPTKDLDDECPLPRRSPRDVPDVQIIAREELDRAFLSYVEKTFENRGIRCNVLILSPRLNEPAVVRRQIIEGVQAVMKLNRTVQTSQRFPLSVFDRSAGANNVRFEEYNDLDLHICVELVIRAKQAQRAAQANSAPQDAAAYAASQYGLPVVQSQPQPQQQPPPPPQQQQYLPTQQQPPQGHSNQANLSNMLSSLDTSTLSQLLGKMQPSVPTPQTPQFPYAPQQASATMDLSKLLGGGVSVNLNPSAYQQPQQQQQLPGQFANLASNPAFSGLFNGAVGGRPQQQLTPQLQQQAGRQQQQTSSQQTSDMSNIIAQLARYGGR